MIDDDIWTTSDAEPAATTDLAPADEPGGRGFWTVGRAVLVLVVAVAVGALAYWVVSRGDDDTVNASGDMAPSNEIPATDLWGRNWEVVRLEMGAENPVSWQKGDTATALYVDFTEQGQVRYTGCNGGAGSATLTGGVLTAADLVSTEMACEGDEGQQLLAYDAWMAGFLTEGALVAFDDDGMLVLAGPDGKAWLTGPGELAEPDPAPGGDPDDPVSNPSETVDLWGYQWDLRAISPAEALENQPIAPLPDGTKPVIDTTTPDVLTISGCNGTGGAVHLEGDTLVADGPWVQTKMACEPDLMDQEQFLTEFLQSGPSVSIKDDLLTLAGTDFLVLAVRS
ncbi:MAG: META domain-containing protein [Aquihabitans sp.]